MGEGEGASRGGLGAYDFRGGQLRTIFRFPPGRRPRQTRLVFVGAEHCWPQGLSSWGRVSQGHSTHFRPCKLPEGLRMPPQAHRRFDSERLLSPKESSVRARSLPCDAARAEGQLAASFRLQAVGFESSGVGPGIQIWECWARGRSAGSAGKLYPPCSHPSSKPLASSLSRL